MSSIRIALVILLAMFTSACTTWRPLLTPSPSDTSVYLAREARLVLVRGDAVTLRRITFTRDSIVGVGADSLPHRFARRDVVRMEREDVSTGRTLVVTLVMGVIGFYGLLILLFASGY